MTVDLFANLYDSFMATLECHIKHPSTGPTTELGMLVKLRTGMLLLSLVTLSLVACNKKDLSPPPLNPHPKEALHVTVTFDNPEDAQRYAVVMKAPYRTVNPGCGYMDYFGAVGGIYRSPQGTFDLPNESRDPQRTEFNIYLDRYNQEACNWELAAPSFIVRDTYTGRRALGHWRLDEDLIPGREYKAVASSKSTTSHRPATADGPCRTYLITALYPLRFAKRTTQVRDALNDDSDGLV